MAVVCIDSIPSAELRGTKVFLRVDFNVPLNKDTGAIASDARLRVVVPTIRVLSASGAKVIVCSHLGRPTGVTPQLSLERVVQPLARMLSGNGGSASGAKPNVSFVAATVGPAVEAAVAQMADGDVLILENVRFCPEEEQNDVAFALMLHASTGAQIYVNDAFSASHRAHASTAALPRLMPGRAFAGLALAQEVAALTQIFAQPARPFVAVLGGAKPSTKLCLLRALVGKVRPPPPHLLHSSPVLGLLSSPLFRPLGGQ